MESASEEVLRRLEDTVNAWDQQIIRAGEEFNRKLEEISTRIDALREDWQEKAEAASREEAGMLRQELDAAWEEIGAQKEKVAALEKTEEAVTAEKQQLADTLAELHGIVENRESECDELRRQVREVREENALLRQEKGDSEQLHGLLEQALANCDAAHGEIESLQAELKRREQAPARDIDLSQVETLDTRGRRRRFGDIMLDAGILTQQQLEELLAAQGSGGARRRLGELVVEYGYSTEEVIARVLAAQLGFTYLDLEISRVDPLAPMMINEALARQHKCIPVRLENDQLMVAMANPLDLIAIDDIELASSHPVLPAAATPSKIYQAIVHFYGG